MAVDMTAPEVQEAIAAEAAKIKAQLEDQYSGVVKNKDVILQEKKKLQEEYEQFKSQFDGVDAKAVKEMMERINKDENAKLIAEGKWDEVVNKRTDIMRKDFENKSNALTQENEVLKKELSRLAEEKNRYVVDGEVQKVAGKYINPEFQDYVLRLARETFKLDEDGNIGAFNSDGTTILGKDGKSSLTPEDWVLSMQQKMPSMFLTSSGAGAEGVKVKSKGGIRYKDDLANAAEKAKYIGEHGMDAYLDLPNKK